ncbi:MAG: zinc-binding alcohol dehydrogenase [Planctomycetes bacterium]|nr:zinc-binding alcohol dehydrogenase [Planctomycetota bacterium]
MVAARRLVFTGKQEVALEEFAVAEPGPGQLLVRSVRTLMSTGTENIVFNRAFAPGTHWDNWVKYPFFPGYCAVGEVAACGAGVADRTGQLVALRSGHASHHIIEAEKALPVDGIDPAQAAWFALAKIAFMGARQAEYRLGDDVLVIGAGPIGQMSVRWAAAAGAGRVSVIDLETKRLELARRGGASLVLSKPVGEALDELRAHHDGELPRLVIDTTGNAAVFSAALSAVRTHGKLVLVGDTGRPGEQHLTPDLITRGLTIVGAHDCHNDATWNDASITRLFRRLVLDGRFDLGGLNTDEFAPEQCVEAYAAANTRRGSTMGLVFNWG